MTEEMRNEEMEVMEDEVTTYDLDEYDDEYEESSGILGKLVAGTVTAATAVAGTAVAGVLVYKNKERISEWRDKRRIEKLEKRGYVVSIPDDDCRVIKEEVVETEDE